MKVQHLPDIELLNGMQQDDETCFDGANVTFFRK
jgi:hypothetical protein